MSHFVLPHSPQVYKLDIHTLSNTMSDPNHHDNDDEFNNDEDEDSNDVFIDESDIIHEVASDDELLPDAADGPPDGGPNPPDGSPDQGGLHSNIDFFLFQYYINSIFDTILF